MPPPDPDGKPTRSLADLIPDPTLSLYREHLFAQLFVADLLKAAWVGGYPPLEVAHPEVDFQGYDLILTCGRVTRHVQVKGGRRLSRRGRRARCFGIQAVACVIFLRPTVFGAVDIRFVYRFFGAAPGQPLTLTGLRTARATTYARTGAGEPYLKERSKRSNHRRVSVGRFDKGVDPLGLLNKLFGPAA